MNKKGATQARLGVVILIVAIGLVVAYFLFGKGTTGGTGGTGFTFPVATALTFSGYDKASPGTVFTPTTVSVSVNGAAYDDSITDVSAGDTIEIVAEEATYHNAYVSPITLPTDKTSKIVSIPFNLAASTASLVIYNEDGDVDDQTASLGGSYQLPFKVKGVDGASTQDMRCILEVTDATLIKDLKLSLPGASYKGKDKPSWYTVSDPDSGVWVYEVSSVDGAITVPGTVAVNGKTGETLAGEDVIVTCYSKEHDIDAFTGKHIYDVEDSQGNDIHIDDYTITEAFV